MNWAQRKIWSVFVLAVRFSSTAPVWRSCGRAANWNNRFCWNGMNALFKFYYYITLIMNWQFIASVDASMCQSIVASASSFADDAWHTWIAFNGIGTSATSLILIPYYDNMSPNCILYPSPPSSWSYACDQSLLLYICTCKKVFFCVYVRVYLFQKVYNMD